LLLSPLKLAIEHANCRFEILGINHMTGSYSVVVRVRLIDEMFKIYSKWAFARDAYLVKAAKEQMRQFSGVQQALQD
jgi:N12 class adenine-specific DNA methylase